MNICAIKLRIATARGEYGFQFQFGKGLTVIRGSNSSGKSTLFNCLMYGLGMEELVGGRGEKVLPYAVKEFFNLNEERVEVVASEVFVELESSGGVKAILRRAIRDSVRDTKLVEVFSGSHLTLSSLNLGSAKPTFLFDAGSARKQEGFHQVLESFMRYQLPSVATTSGGMTKLYLQAVFAAFAVEQKRGWTDYIANIPFFGIRDARMRVTEFLLGLSVFEQQAKRAELDAESIAINADWRRVFDNLRQAAAVNGLVIEGLSTTPTALENGSAVLFMKSNEKTNISR